MENQLWVHCEKSWFFAKQLGWNSHTHSSYFPEKPQEQGLEQMALAMRDAEVFMALISDAYVEDSACCDTFLYACSTLKKPLILVAMGSGYEWRKSKLGILVSDEVCGIIESFIEVILAEMRPWSVTWNCFLSVRLRTCYSTCSMVMLVIFTCAFQLSLYCEVA